VPKIITERCELVKLCHISRSSPVFWDSVLHTRRLSFLKKSKQRTTQKTFSPASTHH